MAALTGVARDSWLLAAEVGLLKAEDGFIPKDQGLEREQGAGAATRPLGEIHGDRSIDR